MLRTHPDVVTILVRKNVVSAAQAGEARARRRGRRVEEALVELGYATPLEVAGAIADYYRVPLVDLDGVTIAPGVIDLVPESIARENTVIPVGREKGRLIVAVADPGDREVLEKLRFILNRDIRLVVAPRGQIVAAINRHYGQTELESVDAMLAEFTDTQMDFTETGAENEPAGKDDFETDFDRPAEVAASAPQAVALEACDSELEDSEFDLACDLSSVDEMLLEAAPAAAPATPAARRKAAAALVERHATVRYYYRMNPLRMYPLLVVISKRQVQEIVKKHVAQNRSENFRVALDSVIEVEPVLPGCQCYPPREQLPVRREEVTARFQVVPQVLGRLEGARVVVRQNGAVLAEVPLELHIVQQGLTMLMGGLSFVLPFGQVVLKQCHLDFDPAAADDFGVSDWLGRWAVPSLSPAALAGILLALTAALYFYLRPRQRDVFWDLRPAPRPGTACAAR